MPKERPIIPGLMPTIHSYAESTLQPNPILEVAVSLLRAVLCQQLHRLAGFEESCRFWLWPFRKNWLLELLPCCRLLWQNKLGFFWWESALPRALYLVLLSWTVFLKALVDFAPIPLQGFPGYSDSSLCGAQCQCCCTSCHQCQGFTIAGPALEYVLSTNKRAQYATAFGQTLFWNAGETLLFSYQYCQIYFTNNINPDFNPLPSPLSSTLPRGLSHSLAQWELLTMRDNRL